MTHQPQTRAELLYNLKERIELAKADGTEVLFVELWEACWLVHGDAGVMDTDGTGQLIGLDFAEVTQTHPRIGTPEQFVSSLDLEAVTTECEVGD